MSAFLFIKLSFTCIWTQTLFFPWCSQVFRDRIQAATWVQQGDPVHYGVTTGFLKVDHEICPSATLRERTAQHQRLMALRQQGTEVGGFAQTFWTSPVGLNYNESVLKDFFNVCLDDPLPQWEMEGLRILNFWGFVRYLHHRSQWATPDNSEPFRRDFPTSPGPLTPLRSDG